MIHAVIEWWCELSRRGKYAFCLATLVLNVGLLLAGRIWIAGWAIALVLLACTMLKVGEE